LAREKRRLAERAAAAEAEAEGLREKEREREREVEEAKKAAEVAEERAVAAESELVLLQSKYEESLAAGAEATLLYERELMSVYELRRRAAQLDKENEALKAAKGANPSEAAAPLGSAVESELAKCREEAEIAKESCAKEVAAASASAASASAAAAAAASGGSGGGGCTEEECKACGGGCQVEKQQLQETVGEIGRLMQRVMECDSELQKEREKAKEAVDELKVGADGKFCCSQECDSAC
jgi:hypothetical protein